MNTSLNDAFAYVDLYLDAMTLDMMQFFLFCLLNASLTLCFHLSNG
jgi:hypothetical protein